MSDCLVQLTHDDRVLNVRTGEQLDLHEAASEELAQAREGLATLRRELDEASAQLDREIVARVDAAIRAGEIDKYTVRVGEYEIKVPSPEAGGKVDAAALREELRGRVRELGLTLEAVNLAFKTKTSYVLDRSAYNTLAKQEPELEALLKRHTGPPERRRATVTVLPGKTGRQPVAVAAVEGGAISGEESFPW